MGSSSKSSTRQETQITDQRAGAQTGTGTAIAVGGGGSKVTITDVSPQVIDAALRELTDLGELTVEEAFAFAGQRGKAADTTQAEALRIVDTVLERQQEPGSGAARNALLATVAVVGLAVAAPAIFKR